nr:VENN motif pre-toxin domain-containing protein [Acinetobacter sp. YH12145]
MLSEAEKAQIRDLTAGIGAVIGGTAGDSSYNAQLAGVIGQNAVENNGLNIGKGKSHKNCLSQGGSRESGAQSLSGLVAYKDLGKDEQEAIYTLSSMIGVNAIIDCASGISADCAISVLETLNPGRKVEAAIDAYKATKKAGDTQKATKAVNDALKDIYTTPKAKEELLDKLSAQM